jgi:hypothetical protein
VFGDIVERTGDQPGLGGGKKGDLVVTLNGAATRGVSVRLTWEVKDRPFGLTAISRELEEARTNRAAVGSIAVYSLPEHMPAGTAPFRELDGAGLLCLYDKNTPDDLLPLQLAYRWARGRALASLRAATPEVDMAGIHEDLETARAQLNGISSMKSKLTSIKSAVESGALHLERDLNSLRDEMTRILERIDTRVRRPRE